MELDQYLENMIFNTNVIWILWNILVRKSRFLESYDTTMYATGEVFF